MTAVDPTAHELYEQLAVGHALSALEPEEEQVFLTHLPSCAACARALAMHAETAAHLAYGADPAEPPASLLEGIRAGVAASGRAGAFPPPATAEVVSLDAARARRTVRFTTAVLGAAASLVLLAALLLVNRDLASKNDQIQARDVALQSAVSGLLQPGAKPVDLTGADGSHAVAVVRGTALSLVVQGLQANDPNSVYVLWQKSRSGGTWAVGAFDVRPGAVTVVNGLHLAGDPTSVKSFVITKEAGRRAPAVAKGTAVVSGEA